MNQVNFGINSCLLAKYLNTCQDLWATSANVKSLLNVLDVTKNNQERTRSSWPQVGGCWQISGFYMR